MLELHSNFVPCMHMHVPSDMASASNPSSITGGAVLPPDAVYEILLRLPAKTLCRLRAACRSWRSLTMDPLFITAHEARNRREPLLLVADGAGGDIYAMDMDGNMVRRLCSSTKEALAAGPLPREHAGPICLVWTPTTGVCVLDAAAGTVTSSLPVDDFDYCAAVRRRWRAGYEAYYALGKAATTGEHKVLRVLRPALSSRRLVHLCDVFTLDDGRREWRPRPRPPVGVLPSGTGTIHDTVIDGIAYFLSDYLTPNNAHEPDCIWSFDLDTEEWSPAPALRGPLSTHGLLHDTTDDDDDDYYYYSDEHRIDRYIELRCELRLTQANGHLVTIRNHRRRAPHDAALDLWFLTDMAKGLWVKQYTIPIMSTGPRRPEVEEYRARPLLVHDDGRVVWSATEGKPRGGAAMSLLCYHEEDAVETVVVRVYDPRDDACGSTRTDVVARVEGGHVVGVCTGGGGSSLLRLSGLNIQ